MAARVSFQTDSPELSKEPLMPFFQCLAIPTAIAENFRATNRDENANLLRHMIADAPTGYPCRHCLKMASPGETLLLGSYNLPRPQGIYASSSPIFVHATACPRFTTPNTLPPVITQAALLSVRAYDQAHQCFYDLGEVAPGAAIEPALYRALAHPKLSFINIHSARPGCLVATIEPFS